MPITRRRRANPPDQPENNNHLAEQTENAARTTDHDSGTPAIEGEAMDTGATVADQTATSFIPPPPLPTIVSNGSEQQNYTSPIEGGRRTPRGELFRRPPQPPATQSLLHPLVPNAAVSPSAEPLQPPTHEISLPLGNLLHLAYNPGYTGADEARSTLLHQLESESNAGGRARCWNCGSIAIAYDRWNTRSKTFGEVGVAYCEICGVWSVL
jgi:hypothetical protein